jgi:predicted dehydrogenase
MSAAANPGQRVRWGIISTADIGMKKVTPGIQRSPHSEVTAIASRDLARAQTAAKQLGIARAEPLRQCPKDRLVM